MAFHVPADSLALRYTEAYREFTWEGARGPFGVKILPEIREQDGPTCIYEATAGWMDMILRLAGIICKISSKDLQMKEQNLMTENMDRIGRCMEVLRSVGLCSEADFKSQNPNPTLYKLNGTRSFGPRFEKGLEEAVRMMKTAPLLAVFHLRMSTYIDYIVRFHQKPVLSYEKYEEGKMQGHAVCVIGYGVESVVPFWKFINSQKSLTGPSKGVGRLMPQNVYYLIAPLGVKIVPTSPPAAPPPPPPAAPQVAAKRKRFEDDHEVDIDAQAMKKRKLDQ